MNAMKTVWLAGPSLLHIKDKPLQLTCLDQPLVLFDTQEGPACLLDTCPHRQASLALGKVNKGCLACPLHGWEFDDSGAVKRIPAHGEHKLGAKFQTRAVKTINIGGWVFIKAGVVLADQTLQFKMVDSQAACEPAFTPAEAPFFSLEPGSWRTISGVYDWQADFTRVTANGIDFSHLPFVHPKQFETAIVPKSVPFVQLALMVGQGLSSCFCLLTIWCRRLCSGWSSVGRSCRSRAQSLS